VVFGKNKKIDQKFYIKYIFRETMANRTSQVSECLHKLYDLMPDGIITYEVSLGFLKIKPIFNTIVLL
jgi:hypothetical protein